MNSYAIVTLADSNYFELLDELIEHNRNNEKFSENNNNLKLSYERFYNQR